MGKGSKQRPLRTGREENELRWAAFMGEITDEEYHKRYAELEKENKIIRDGRRVNESQNTAGTNKKG